MVSFDSTKDKWLSALNAELAGSDRASAVLASALLDDRLKVLLQKYLLPPKNHKQDRLLGRSGVLESFSARIELASRLALIGGETRDSLEWLREIRNAAAHRDEFEFSQNDVIDRVANIINAMLIREKMSSLLTPPYDTPKGQFVAATIMLVMSIEVEIAEVEQTSRQPFNLILNAAPWASE